MTKRYSSKADIVKDPNMKTATLRLPTCLPMEALCSWLKTRESHGVLTPDLKLPVLIFGGFGRTNSELYKWVSGILQRAQNWPRIPNIVLRYLELYACALGAIRHRLEVNLGKMFVSPLRSERLQAKPAITKCINPANFCHVVRLERKTPIIYEILSLATRGSKSLAHAKLYLAHHLYAVYSVLPM